MDKVELLAPAGDFSCLKAAIEAGCDAVYIGGKLFGARAFSSNFTDDEIIKAINYAHLFGVKVYVTTNTLIYDKEVERFLEYISFLHKNNVDAVIIQDLGMLDLVRQTFPNLEVHASTQMHIHNLDGASFMEKLGVKRVVLARETSISKIKEIKEKTNIDIEIFIHGALCVSYSGQCLMSSLIGNRSGNRGTCAGSCRQSYSIVDENNNIILNNKYPLSMKDLCSLENLKTLLDIGVTSLKIEGRMKSSSYVYTVVKLYRLAIDSYYKNNNNEYKDHCLGSDELEEDCCIGSRVVDERESRNFVKDYRTRCVGKQFGIVPTIPYKYVSDIAKIYKNRYFTLDNCYALGYYPQQKIDFSKTWCCIDLVDELHYIGENNQEHLPIKSNFRITDEKFSFPTIIDDKLVLETYDVYQAKMMSISELNLSYGEKLEMI